jgi:hypothetical protein
VPSVEDQLVDLSAWVQQQATGPLPAPRVHRSRRVALGVAIAASAAAVAFVVTRPDPTVDVIGPAHTTTSLVAPTAPVSQTAPASHDSVPVSTPIEGGAAVLLPRWLPTWLPSDLRIDSVAESDGAAGESGVMPADHLAIYRSAEADLHVLVTARHAGSPSPRAGATIEDVGVRAAGRDEGLWSIGAYSYEETLDDATLLAVVERVRVGPDGAPTAEFVPPGFEPLWSGRSGGGTPDSANLAYRGEDDRRLGLTLLAGNVDWYPPREAESVDVRGRPGLYIESSRFTLFPTLRVQLTDDVFAVATGEFLSREELIEVVDSLRPASDEEWAAATATGLATGSVELVGSAAVDAAGALVPVDLGVEMVEAGPLADGSGGACVRVGASTSCVRLNGDTSAQIWFFGGTSHGMLFIDERVASGTWFIERAGAREEGEMTLVGVPGASGARIAVGPQPELGTPSVSGFELVDGDGEVVIVDSPRDRVGA